jgi:hypothetical protein
MANIDKSLKRENKSRKSRQGMRVSNRSIFQIQEAIIKRANKSKARNSRNYHFNMGEER